MYANFKDGKSSKCHTGQYAVDTYRHVFLAFLISNRLEADRDFGSWATWSSRISKAWIQCNDARGQRTHADQSFPLELNALDLTNPFSDCLTSLFCAISFLIAESAWRKKKKFKVCKSGSGLSDLLRSSGHMVVCCMQHSMLSLRFFCT